MGETGLACLSNTKLVCVPILRGGYRAAMATSTRRTVPWDRPLLAACLAPLGLVYRFVMFCRRRLYAMGVLTSHDLGVPVLSVGNLTVGGTGKSPMIDALLTRIAAQGKRAMVLSRGYGAAIDLEGVILNDEGHMLRRKHPEHVHVQGVNRVAAAQHALRSENVDVVLLDDGAQHLRVRRDCDLLHFMHDYCMWTALGAKKNSARGVPPRLALKGASFTPAYWRVRHVGLIDMQRQAGTRLSFAHGRRWRRASRITSGSSRKWRRRGGARCGSPARRRCTWHTS